VHVLLARCDFVIEHVARIVGCIFFTLLATITAAARIMCPCMKRLSDVTLAVEQSGGWACSQGVLVADKW